MTAPAFSSTAFGRAGCQRPSCASTAGCKRLPRVRRCGSGLAIGQSGLSSFARAYERELETEETERELVDELLSLSGMVTLLYAAKDE